MRIGVVSAKGSPGATTVALALATVADGTLIELDPAGGDVECWAGPQGEPGLIRVAGGLRHAAEPADLLHSNAAEVWPGVRAVLAPTGAETAESTLVAIGERLAPVLGMHDGWVVADGGRWSRSQVTARRMAGCDVIALALSPTFAGVEHARWLVGPLTDTFGVPVVGLSVGDRPYPPADVAAALGTPVAGVAAWDPRGVQTLVTVGASRLWRRSGLARSARSLLDGLERFSTRAVVGRG